MRARARMAVASPMVARRRLAPFVATTGIIPVAGDAVVPFYGEPGQIVVLRTTFGSLTIGISGQPNIVTDATGEIAIAADQPGAIYNIDIHNNATSPSSAQVTATVVSGAATISPSPGYHYAGCGYHCREKMLSPADSSGDYFSRDDGRACAHQSVLT